MANVDTSADNPQLVLDATERSREFTVPGGESGRFVAFFMEVPKETVLEIKVVVDGVPEWLSTDYITPGNFPGRNGSIFLDLPAGTFRFRVQDVGARIWLGV